MKTPPLQALWGALAAALTLSLSACGGGGGDSGGPPPVVTSSGVTPGVKYSDSMLVTLNGTNLASLAAPRALADALSGTDEATLIYERGGQRRTLKIVRVAS